MVHLGWSNLPGPPLGGLFSTETRGRPMFPIPKCVFLTHGVGIHRHLLTAFEYALRNADIEQQNIVTVSSILPPGCELITRASGVATLSPGELTFCVLARSETNEPGRRIAAGIGLARPKDPTHYGYISEHHAFGMSEAADARLRRGSRRHHAGLHARHRIQSRCRLGRAQAGLRIERSHRRQPFDHRVGGRRGQRRLDLCGLGRGVPLRHSARRTP